jgi:hypothetical protein
MCESDNERRDGLHATHIWRRLRRIRPAIALLLVVAIAPQQVLGQRPASSTSVAGASGYGNDILHPGQVSIGAEAGFDMPTPIGVGARLGVGVPGMVQLSVSASTAVVAVNWAIAARTVVLGRHRDISLGVDLAVGQWWLMASEWGNHRWS